MFINKYDYKITRTTNVIKGLKFVLKFVLKFLDLVLTVSLKYSK